MSKIQLRKDTAANWSNENPIMAAGEFGFEIDTNKGKFGDGSTAYNALAYFGGSSGGGGSGPTYVESSPIAIVTTADHNYVFAHGLSAVQEAGMFLEQVVAVDGYSVGDRIVLDAFETATTMGTLSFDATDVNLAMDNKLDAVNVVPKHGTSSLAWTASERNLILWAKGTP